MHPCEDMVLGRQLREIVRVAGCENEYKRRLISVIVQLHLIFEYSWVD